MTDTYTIRLPWPDRGLQSNARSRTHHKKDRLTKIAREYAWGVGLDARIPKIPDAVIFIEYYPKAYRGDVHNVASALKAYIDGIADAMGCDDRGFRVSYPDQWAGKTKNGEVVFRIMRPLEACGMDVKESK